MILIRFLFNFLLFGILFYLIYHFFPDTFNTLVSWVRSIVDYLISLFNLAWEKVEHKEEHHEPIKSAFILILSRFFV